LIASPLIVPVSGVSPRGLTILPPSVSPVCVKTASEAREPIGLSTFSSHVPDTSVTLAAGGGGGGADWGALVVEQAAATVATAATHRRRKAWIREVDIGLTPMSSEGFRRRAYSWRRCFNPRTA
jgi:hypothetical protein